MKVEMECNLAHLFARGRRLIVELTYVARGRRLKVELTYVLWRGF